MAAPQGYGQYTRRRSARAGLGCQLSGAGLSHRLAQMSLFGVRPGQPRYGVLPWAHPDGRPGTSTLHRDSVASTPLFWSVAHSCISQPVETCALDFGAVLFFSCVPPLLPGRRLTLWNTGLLDFWKSQKKGTRQRSASHGSLRRKRNLLGFILFRVGLFVVRQKHAPLIARSFWSC